MKIKLLVLQPSQLSTRPNASGDRTCERGELPPGLPVTGNQPITSLLLITNQELKNTKQKEKNPKRLVRSRSPPQERSGLGQARLSPPLQRRKASRTTLAPGTDETNLKDLRHAAARGHSKFLTDTAAGSGCSVLQHPRRASPGRYGHALVRRALHLTRSRVQVLALRSCSQDNHHAGAKFSIAVMKDRVFRERFRQQLKSPARPSAARAPARAGALIKKVSLEGSNPLST